MEKIVAKVRLINSESKLTEAIKAKKIVTGLNETRIVKIRPSKSFVILHQPHFCGLSLAFHSIICRIYFFSCFLFFEQVNAVKNVTIKS